LRTASNNNKVSQDKTLHTPKINAVIRVHDIGIPKLEVPLYHCQAAVPQQELQSPQILILPYPVDGKAMAQRVGVYLLLDRQAIDERCYTPAGGLT